MSIKYFSDFDNTEIAEADVRRIGVSARIKIKGRGEWIADKVWMVSPADEAAAQTAIDTLLQNLDAARDQFISDIQALIT